MHPDWEKSKERFEALWQNELVDRCCVRVVANKNGTMENKPFPDSEADRQAYWLDGEVVYQREVFKIQQTYYAGDAFPHMFSNFGAAGHAAFFKNVKTGFHESIWMEPDAQVQVGLPFNIELDPESLILKKTYEVIQYLVDQSNGQYFVSMPDISGNLDALAHMRKSDTLLLDMVMQPQSVQNALNQIMSIWKEVVLKVQKMTTDCNDGGNTIGWLDTWAPGLHAQMQCDLSVMISSEMFETYAMPELIEQADYLEYPLYHFDGVEQIRHLDMLISIDKLKMIQWTNVAGQPSPVEYIPVLQKMQEAGKGLLIRIENINNIEPLMSALSSKGLYLYVEPTLDSPEEADKVVELVTKLTHD